MRLLSFSSIALLQLSFITARHGTKWTYAGPEGQDHWDENYPYCGGAFQSPININSELMRFDPTLRPINVRNYNLSPNEQLTFGNNGHSVQLSLPSKMYISGLPHYYSAAQLHFHWGSSSKPMGSEHLVNNKQYAAEMHIVHYNSDKYPNISMAVDKSDGLAVLGVLIEVGEFNPAFEQFLKFLNGIKYRDQKVQVPGFNIRSLLPTQLNEYYRYDGSLTTPPCYPSVLWTVFRNPVTLSHEQYMALATTLFSSHAQDSVSVMLNSNYRKPQPMDSRIVLVSFKEGDPSWINTEIDSLKRIITFSPCLSGLMVPAVVCSALGMVLIVSIICCLFRQKRSGAQQEKNQSVGYNIGEQDEYGSRV
ncbi:carbonic anhydrase 12 isoform X3 [Takifugu flavidus]|uniref:carbonic anhydrase 12 isoform X3 n=1 Tax=Takifugu flavidus TaxID=433684 RepID=UPI0025448D92|nr:carbonic anhydrase 12 isoform X3 [Takifugu flavidus]